MSLDAFLLRYLDNKFTDLKKSVLSAIAALDRKEDQIMGAITQLGTALGSIADSQANIAADIKKLQDQIAAGGTITEAQLQPFADQATAAAASLKALADSVPDDAPTPTEPPDNP